MMGGKKGQVAIFIIIGIIILFSAGTYFYLKGQIGEAFFLKRAEVPLNQYVDECIDFVASEAITIMGQRGGYIYLPDYVKYDPFATIPGLSGLGMGVTAMWYHSGLNQEPMDDEFIYVMEDQINSYVDYNLFRCLAGFEGFTEFEVTVMGPPVTSTTIGEDDVTVEVQLPLEVKNLEEDKITKVDTFGTILPYKVRQAWELARDILKAENKIPFIERKVIDLMTLDDDGKFSSVPVSGIEFQCSPKMWLVPKVKQRLQRLLENNIPFIRVLGTDIPDYRDYSEDDCKLPEPLTIEGALAWKSDPPSNLCYFKSHYEWNVSNDETYPGMKVGFTYSRNWPVDMVVEPSDGMVLKSGNQKGTQFLSWLCLQIYKFAYDLQFPLMVTVTSDEIGYRPFTFNYGLEVTIRKNYPDRTTQGTGVRRSRQWTTNDEFCEDDFHNKLATIRVWNSRTKQPVKGVRVKYTCGKFSCNAGTTDWRRGEYIGASGAIIEKQLPYCVSALLTAEDPACDNYFSPECSYDPKTVFFSNSKRNPEDRVADIYLEPLKRIVDYEVRVMRTSGLQWARMLSAARGEAALITISNKNKTFTTSVIYTPTNEEMFALPIDMPGNIDDVYDVEIYIIKGLASNNADDFAFLGGYKAEWDVKWTLLKNAKKIIFTAAEQYPIPEDEEEQFQFLMNLEEYSKNVTEVYPIRLE
jgi:hypothetical protein